MKLNTTFSAPDSFPLRGKAGMGAATALAGAAPLAPTPTLPQRGREQLRLPLHRLRMARSAMDN
jgi:NitT/TauT family transport system ATP-binding protein